MVVGVARITLLIHSSFSLKDKRSVLRRIKDRTANTFNVSIAEVERHDIHNLAVLGLAVVGRDRARVDSLMTSIVNFIDDLHVAELIEDEKELLDY